MSPPCFEMKRGPWWHNQPWNIIFLTISDVITLFHLSCLHCPLVTFIPHYSENCLHVMGHYWWVVVVFFSIMVHKYKYLVLLCTYSSLLGNPGKKKTEWYFNYPRIIFIPTQASGNSCLVVCLTQKSSSSYFNSQRVIKQSFGWRNDTSTKKVYSKKWHVHWSP